MKKMFFITLAVFMLACQQEKSPEAIQKEISKHKQAVNDLNHKISELEKQLVANGFDLNDKARVAVSVQELQEVKFDNFFNVSGSAEAVNQAFISPEMSGQIEKIYVKKGQRVEAGQTLAKLNTVITDNSILEVKTSLELAKATYERQRELWQQSIGSEIQYLQAKNAKESLEARLKTLEAQRNMSFLKAPFTGIVDDIMIKEGELASPGQRAMLLVNLSSVYINSEVSESFLPVIKVGDLAKITFPTYPGLEYNVPVWRVGNVINPENRTFKVQMLLNNTGDKIKPNLIATVSLKSFSKESVILVPSILIKQDATGSFVYAVDENQGELVARKVYVQRGATSEGMTLIEEGLKSGDRIVVQGHSQIAEGSMLRIVDASELAGISRK